MDIQQDKDKNENKIDTQEIARFLSLDVRVSF